MKSAVFAENTSYWKWKLSILGERGFGSVAEVNAGLGERSRSLWSELRPHEHKQFSVPELLELRQPQPMPEPFDGQVENPARAFSTCLVSVARKLQWVPSELASQPVSTRLYPGRLVIVAQDKVNASHEHLSYRGQTPYDWQHYIPLVQRKPGVLRNGAPLAEMPQALIALQRALLRRWGGDRLWRRCWPCTHCRTGRGAGGAEPGAGHRRGQR